MNSNESIEQERNSIAKILAEARQSLLRVTPEQLSGERENGTLVIDIRPVEQRQRDGDLPGAIVIDRNVLEWRLDPSSEHRIPQVTGYDIRIVVVCNEGYSSSLAAAVLQKLGLHKAVDMIGGYQAWLAIS
jgi:rhodanese-related sulfurtransferase